MRRSREAKAQTRDAILRQASQLFLERGVAGTSIGDVTARAGITHGGFYRHFETKDALVAAAIEATFDGIAGALEGQTAAVGANRAVSDYFSTYLSDEHLANPGLGCPIPALASEIARGPEALKADFGAGLSRSLSRIAKAFAGDEKARRAAAMRELAMRAGAILIARASDAATAREVLTACRPPGDPAQSAN